MARLAEQQPTFVRRFVELHEIFRRTSQRLEMVDETFSVDNSSGARLPWEEVRDRFHLTNTYVDLLDRSAEALGNAIGSDGSGSSTEALRSYLADQHRVEVVLQEADALRDYDERKRLLRIDAGQPVSGIRFQLAYHVAALSLGDTIDEIARTADLKSSAARELLKVGLANYAAGAVLMPYERFRRSARKVRHDIDRLSLAYRTSFEQTCHRLSTLQREGARGLPMFFCRVDMAGNITKRHAAAVRPLRRGLPAVDRPRGGRHSRSHSCATGRGAGWGALCLDGERSRQAVGPFDRNPRPYAVA